MVYVHNTRTIIVGVFVINLYTQEIVNIGHILNTYITNTSSEHNRL